MSITPITTPAPVTTSTANQDKTDALANKDTFMKLLVAQLQNQNPLSPADGVQFLSQLTQFSGLEQQIEMKTSLDAIKTDLDKLANPVTPPVKGN